MKTFKQFLEDTNDNYASIYLHTLAQIENSFGVVGHSHYPEVQAIVDQAKRDVRQAIQRLRDNLSSGRRVA